MLIDWFTVIAQVINFLILVWLLKRLLYQPILNALDARERRIAAELAEADVKKSEAEKERDEFQRKNDEFDQQRTALLSEARDRAQAERQRLIAAAREDSRNLRIMQEDALKREYQSLSEALTRQTCVEVFAIAGKVLTDLASTTLELHMAEAFVKRLRELNHDEKVHLALAFRESGSAPAPTAVVAGKAAAWVVVRSAFDLPVAQQKTIESVLEQILETGVSVRFEAEPELISGIELIANGYKVAWSVKEYLASLEKEIGNLLKIHVQPESSPKPEIEAPPNNDPDDSKSA